MMIPLSEAAARLQQGDVVAIPTETVYGLAACLNCESAIQKIFTLKNRPQDNPLIVHVAHESDLPNLVREIPASFEKIKKFWPGPLTVIFKANADAVSTTVRAGLPTVGVRIPNHPLTLELLQLTGPLVAPSANVSGRPSATCAEHVTTDFGDSVAVLDGGVCAKGVESTIIALAEDHWELLRRGAIAEDALITALGSKPRATIVGEKPRSPGQKYRHYAPRARLRLCLSAAELRQQEEGGDFDAVLGFEDTTTALKKISLGHRNDHSENLKRLYQKLRELDECGFENALVDVDFDVTGLGETLAERLQKAASK